MRSAPSPRHPRTSVAVAVAAEPAAREGRCADDELRVPAAQAQLDGARGELRGDLLGSGPEGVDEHEADGRVERRQETVGGAAHVLTADLGSGAELTMQAVDVRCELHDVSMTSQ